MEESCRIAESGGVLDVQYFMLFSLGAHGFLGLLVSSVGVMDDHFARSRQVRHGATSQCEHHESWTRRNQFKEYGVKGSFFPRLMRCTKQDVQ